MNSRKQGDVGTGYAITYFLCNEYTVSIPISDSQMYDLIVEKNNVCFRVQVKTSFKKNKYGKYIIELRTISNRKNRKLDIRKLSKNNCDLVFIVDGDMKKYCIPSETLDNRGQVTISTLKSYMVG